MSICDRYIAAAILKNVLLVLVSLVALMSLSALVKELDDVGEGQYGILDALTVIGLTAPERAVDLFSVSALVGCILGLGALAATNEILIMRVAGMSPFRVARSVFMAGLPLVLLVAALTEYVVPPLSQDALIRRNVAVSGARAALTKKALWLREGDTIVRIGTVRLGGIPTDLQIYVFRGGGHLKEVIRAASARVAKDGQWVLHDVEHIDVVEETPPTRHATYPLREGLEGWDLDLVVSRPEALSMSDLHSRLDTRDDVQRDKELESVLWRKLCAPFLTLAMLLLAVPFVLGRGAASALGRRVVQGSVIGVIAYLLVQVVGYLGLVLELSPFAVAAAPVFITVLITVILLMSMD